MNRIFGSDFFNDLYSATWATTIFHDWKMSIFKLTSIKTFNWIELDILASLRIESHLLFAFVEPDNSHKHQNYVSYKSCDQNNVDGFYKVVLQILNL